MHKPKNLFYQEVNPLPREVAPNLFWLGECFNYGFLHEPLHSYTSMFFVRGKNASMVIETGTPPSMDACHAQLATLLDDSPPLKYIWATHQETPHAGGIGRLLERYPTANYVGNAKDYHLIFPGFEDRFHPLDIGDSVDLGGTKFVAVEAVIRDLLTTQWGFLTTEKAMFVGDGFAYSHFHGFDQCGQVGDEMPDLPVAELGALFAEVALYWWAFCDLEPFIEKLDKLVAELDPQIVFPTHGSPIVGVKQFLPKIRDGLRRGSELTPNDAPAILQSTAVSR